MNGDEHASDHASIIGLRLLNCWRRMFAMFDKVVASNRDVGRLDLVHFFGVTEKRVMNQERDGSKKGRGHENK